MLHPAASLSWKPSQASLPPNPSQRLMSDSDFLSFENALDELSLEEDDLKRLISAGEIRAFREGSKMRLRTEDVTRVASDLGVGESVSEEDAGDVLEVEEVHFDAEEDDQDEGMVTTQLTEEDTLLDDDLEVVEIDDEPEDASPVAAAASRRGRATAETVEEESGGIRGVTILTTLLMAYGLAFVLAMLQARSNGVTDGLVETFK